MSFPRSKSSMGRTFSTYVR